MTTRKLSTTDAFVVVDLDGVAPAAGLVRLAPKILVEGATWLARSQTYQFASFGRRASGASAGVNARPDDRDAAVAAFVAELAPDVETGAFLLEAGRGLADDDLAALRGADPRPGAWWEQRAVLRAAGVAEAAAVALGGLEGRSVAVELHEAAGPELLAALAERGATLRAVGTAAGAVEAADGLAADELAAAWAAGGADGVAALGNPAPSLLAVEADALLVGSKAGVVDHAVAGEVRARAVVPDGPIPVTAKALAELTRAGTVVLPDFVTTGGHLVAWPEDASASPGGAAEAAAAVRAVLEEVADHPRGPLLGACERAEAFLRTWRDELPFGRPIA